MVTELNHLIKQKDFKNEDHCRSLVFICANNQDFELPFTYLLNYKVFENYAEYWDKGREIVNRNTELLNELYRTEPVKPELEFNKEKLTRANKLALQKKAIAKYLKHYPLK